MNRNAMIGALAAASVLVSGCSTRPRNFTAELSAPVPDRAAFEDDFRTCQTLVRQGRTSDFKGGATTALATGVGTIGAGAAMAGTGMVGITTGGGAAVLASAVMPVVGIFFGFGVSRMIRSGKERKYKRVMDVCLTEYGYRIGSWAKVNKKDDAAKLAADSAKVVPAVLDSAATGVAVEAPATTEATLIAVSQSDPGR